MSNVINVDNEIAGKLKILRLFQIIFAVVAILFGTVVFLLRYVPEDFRAAVGVIAFGISSMGLILIPTLFFIEYKVRNRLYPGLKPVESMSIEEYQEAVYYSLYSRKVVKYIFASAVGFVLVFILQASKLSVDANKFFLDCASVAIIVVIGLLYAVIRHTARQVREQLRRLPLQVPPKDA